MDHIGTYRISAKGILSVLAFLWAVGLMLNSTPTPVAAYCDACAMRQLVGLLPPFL